MHENTWQDAAIEDDNLVANILLHFKHSSSSLQNHLPPSWGLRHPRSKPTSSSPDKFLLTRRSPTTPLSWTTDDQTSPENHRLPPPYDFFTRSKVSAASDTPTNSRKRTKRKKSFAELKEEESSLLKEHIHLKQEFATLHVTLQEQKSINESLKRIKLDLQMESGIKSEANSVPRELTMFLDRTSEATSSSVSKQVKTEDASEHSHPAQTGASPPEPVFMLPDLNMALEDECDIFGMS